MALGRIVALLLLVAGFVAHGGMLWGDEPPASGPKVGDAPLPTNKPPKKKPAKTPAKPQRIVQLGDGTVTLTGRDVSLHGAKVRYEPEKDAIGYWTRVDDYVSWDLAITRPGRFAVEVYQSSGQGDAGSEYTVEIGDQKLENRVQDTASFKIFRRRLIGVVELKEPGRYTLTVRPRSKAGLAVMDLRWVKLTLLKPKQEPTSAPETPEPPTPAGKPPDVVKSVADPGLPQPPAGGK